MRLSKKAFATLYALLGVGLIGSFLGHGLWGATEWHETFPALLTGSLDNVLGYDMNDETAVQYVQAIGFVDLAVAAAVTVFTLAAVIGRNGVALSRVALVVYGYAVVWGFLTAASRPLSADAEWGKEVLDLVERAPNFMLPAALAYLVWVARGRRWSNA